MNQSRTSLETFLIKTEIYPKDKSKDSYFKIVINFLRNFFLIEFFLNKLNR